MYGYDPKHTSRYGAEWMANRTGGEHLLSPPDINPIDNLWHEFKIRIEFFCGIKPNIKHNLLHLDGIVVFFFFF